MANLRWEKQAGSTEWEAESGVDDSMYVIDEDPVHGISELFVVWGRGDMVGDQLLGEYPDFVRAAEQAEREEAKMREEVRLESMAMAEQREELEGMPGYPDPEDEIERRREQRRQQRQDYLEARMR